MSSPTTPNDVALVTFRQSIFFLIYRLIGIEILLALLYLLLRIPKTFLFGLDIPFDTLVQIQWIGVVYFIILSIIQTALVIYVVIQYESQSYEVHQQLLAKNSGIINKNTETYSIRNIESVIVKQGILGRLFKYGDVTIHNPALKQDFHLPGIPNPHYYADLIENSVARITQLRMAPSK